MKKIYFPFIALLFLSLSCKTESKKATEFNNKLAAINKEIASKGQDLQPVLQSAIATKDFSKLAKPIDDFKSYVDTKLTEVSAMENVGGSDKFKAAFIDFLKYEKEMAVTLEPFTKMNENTPNEEATALTNKVMEKAQEESVVLNKLKSVQQEFASKHGFKIQPTDY